MSCGVRVQPLINLVACGALIGRRNPVRFLRHMRHKNGQDANASMTNAFEQTRRETLLLGAAALVSSSHRMSKQAKTSSAMGYRLSAI